MTLRTICIRAVLSALFCCCAFADRNLSTEEITNLFQELTSNPKSTWIRAGTIEATKEEYRAPKTVDEQQISNAIKKKIEEYQSNDKKPEKAAQLQKMALDAIPFNVRYHMSNEYTMKSSTIVKYDGTRYYCDITVNSRQDSVQVPELLKSNQTTDEFKLTWNRRRILCFDGKNNITYTPAVNHALIESSGIYPQGVIDILSIGILPWGYNNYAYDKLLKIQYSAIEKTVDGHSIIQLNLKFSDKDEHTLILDPQKQYKPLTWVIKGNNFVKVHQYGGYKLISDSWVPASIVIEKFDADGIKLLEGDYVNITSINGDTPSPASFTVGFGPDTFIEHLYDISKPELTYYYSNTANIELLLAERMAYMASEGKKLQNCATAALQYAALQLGKDILNEQLSQLVNPVDFTTNLHSLKKYAENAGFKCKTVKADIESLKNLTGCKAILHIPGTRHFVLLDKIDEKYVWLIDLSRDKFYYRSDIAFFGMSWTEGTALLISNQSISLPDRATEILDSQLAGYIGASGWSCTLILQEFLILTCLQDPWDGTCYGIYQVFHKRKGCEIAESGECPEAYLVRKTTWPCINDIYNPFACQILVSGRQFYYVLACQ